MALFCLNGGAPQPSLVPRGLMMRRFPASRPRHSPRQAPNLSEADWPPRPLSTEVSQQALLCHWHKRVKQGRLRALLVTTQDCLWIYLPSITPAQRSLSRRWSDTVLGTGDTAASWALGIRRPPGVHLVYRTGADAGRIPLDSPAGRGAADQHALVGRIRSQGLGSREHSGFHGADGLVHPGVRGGTAPLSASLLIRLV